MEEAKVRRLLLISWPIVRPSNDPSFINHHILFMFCSLCTSMEIFLIIYMYSCLFGFENHLFSMKIVVEFLRIWIYLIARLSQFYYLNALNVSIIPFPNLIPHPYIKNP